MSHLQYLSDVLFALSVLGYIKSSGLLPNGIEVYIQSIEPIDEMKEIDVEDVINDKKVFDDFKNVQNIQELKLIALQALSSVNNQQKDTLIKGFFACKSVQDLINLIQNYINPNDGIFKAFRGEAIKEKEDELNDEQRLVYNAPINEHINVTAGPGSGKTHTLSLRVAKLVHHIGVAPEEILVLAYNRAVVSELKNRLGTLFAKLGYSSLAKRINIYTFHELALRTCRAKIENNGDKLSFEQWESTLRDELTNNPGLVMNRLGNIRHILIDEFQDINEIRIEILGLLTKQLPNMKIFIIGDPNQSIYGYSRRVMDPYYYYNEFNEDFAPLQFNLVSNYRSYPKILEDASSLLLEVGAENTLVQFTQAFYQAPAYFINPYVEIIDLTQQNMPSWESCLKQLLVEEHQLKAYSQIAVMFRTNKELYRGYQKIQQLNVGGVRIRIQGSSSAEFVKIRECFHFLKFIEESKCTSVPELKKNLTKVSVDKVIKKYPNWDSFYLEVLLALVSDYIENKDDLFKIEDLIEYIREITNRDDGQLYKIHQNYIGKLVEDKLVPSGNSNTTEIVLTTMHKVKGLEYDAVIVTPSFADLPLKNNTPFLLQDQIEEEKRLLYVACTRAKYRLLAFQHSRELALLNNQGHSWGNALLGLGVPVGPELDKLQLSWAARAFNFNRIINNKKTNDYIRDEIKVGDTVSIVRNGNFIELKHSNRTVAGLVRNKINMGNANRLDGYIVSEVIVYTFQDCLDYDARNSSRTGVNFTDDWCDDAKKQGYIYLVNFAGYGNP